MNKSKGSSSNLSSHEKEFWLRSFAERSDSSVNISLFFSTHGWDFKEFSNWNLGTGGGGCR